MKTKTTGTLRNYVYRSNKISVRNSNIEFLRVISMLMIVAYHYAIFGFYAEDLMYSSNKYFVDIFGMGGKIGTDLFVLVSGYYMINSGFTLKKLLNLMGQVWFYSIGTFIVFALIRGFDAVRGVINISLFPLLTSHYWFASYYVLLMLLSPFLNTLIHRLDKQQHGLLCMLLFMLCCFIPEFLHINFASGSLPLFVALYVCAAYCRLHIGHERKVANRCLILALLFTLLCVARIIVCDSLWQRAGDSARLVNSVNFMGAYSPFAFVIAMMLLLAGCCREPGKRRFISVLGSCTFGVYLCHSNQLVGSILWQDIFHTSSLVASPWLFAHALLTVALIFVICCIIDLLRQYSFAPLWEKLTAKIAPVAEPWLDKGTAFVLQLLHILIGDGLSKTK